MRSRDLIDGFDYGEYMQRQMFCFGSDDNDSGDSDSSYSGGLDFDEEDSGDYGSSPSSSPGGGGGGGGGVDSGGFTAAERAAGQAARNAIDAHNRAVAAGQRPGEGSTDYTQQFGAGVANAMANAEQQRLAEQVAQSYIDNASIMGPELYSAGNVGGSLLDFFKTGSTGSVPIRSNYFDDPTTLSAFKDIALGQIPGRMEKAGAIPGVLGAVGTFTLGRMQKALEEGGRPVFDSAGNLKGVFSEGLFGEVYTGMPVEGVEGTGYDAGGDRGGDTPAIKQVNPVTGQCDEGYMFDEDLQACRLDTRGGAGTTPITPTPPFAPGAYARMGLLDRTPTGALQAGGQPFDFAAANRAFRMGTATRPEYFKDPYDLTGYTLLG
jgi:hypothetical protein